MDSVDPQPRIGSFQGCSPGGFHEVFYTEWGDPAAARVVVCCHGLTRNGRDFDVLAARLAATAPVRVICPDVAGRGRSQWLMDPLHYGYPQYIADMTALILRLGVPRVDWIGTSMGGLIGMFLAAAPNGPIRSLVMNDVGPVLSRAPLQRIADYVGLDERFATLGALEAHLRRVHAPFGPLTDAQWRHLTRHGHRFNADGSYGLAYDPRIAVNVKLGVQDWDFWSVWDSITCPVLVLRGAQSDLLSAEVADAMSQGGSQGRGSQGRGPKAELATFDGIGHAPALMSREQVEIVAQWLERQA
jgi:pimeloyl-ACP methyl ester carboxylesterase